MKFTQRGHGDRMTYWIDGRQVKKDEFDTEMEAARPKVQLRGGSSRQCTAWSRPLASEALAVHPKQVKDATDDAARKGVPTEFLADGRPLLRSRGHRAAYLKAYGFFDRDAGYSDPANGSFRG